MHLMPFKTTHRAGMISAGESKLFADSNLLKAWIVSCGAGELLGIGTAAAFAVLLGQILGEPQNLGGKMIMLGGMVFAGCLEGLAVGYFQWRVLKRKFPQMPTRSWLTATIAVAALGWFLGMLYPTFFAEQTKTEAAAPEFGLGLVAILAALFGLATGAIFGGAQWLVLRNHAENAGKWIVGNALGWSAALVWIYLAASLPDERTPKFVIVLLSVCGGLLAGLSVGAVTGGFLCRLKAKISN